eukprot:TRINITY_DN2208_c0_g1_i2.p1 TRINITY_DN2208_c0_g1~~TRINITY_DN2208_c0_g1_i2.p1  ORF type:complete len:581 (-),score=181.62 TRINITY_DN2208_c0_g1_i2:57-1799(-)
MKAKHHKRASSSEQTAAAVAGGGGENAACAGMTEYGFDARVYEVPPIVRDCCAALLEEKALAEEGVFRVPGHAAKVQEIRRQYKTSAALGLQALRAPEMSVHEVASLLKTFLRDDAVPPVLQAALVSATREADKDIRQQCVVRLLLQMPPGNQAILKRVFESLAKIAENSSKNQMTSQKLGVCLAPTLLPPQGSTFEQVQEMLVHGCMAVQTLIDEYVPIFEDHVDVSHSGPQLKQAMENLALKIVASQLDARLSPTQTRRLDAQSVAEIYGVDPGKVDESMKQQCLEGIRNLPAMGMLHFFPGTTGTTGNTRVKASARKGSLGAAQLSTMFSQQHDTATGSSLAGMFAPPSAVGAAPAPASVATPQPASAAVLPKAARQLSDLFAPPPGEVNEQPPPPPPPDEQDVEELPPPPPDEEEEPPPPPPPDEEDLAALANVGDAVVDALHRSEDPISAALRGVDSFVCRLPPLPPPRRPKMPAATVYIPPPTSTPPPAANVAAPSQPPKRPPRQLPQPRAAALNRPPLQRHAMSAELQRNGSSGQILQQRDEAAESALWRKQSLRNLSALLNQRSMGAALAQL